MKRMFVILLSIFAFGCGTDSSIDKILIAKQRVRSMVNYPDTLSFHEFDTNVSGNTVTLKFSCKNAFGVSETHTMNFTVNN